MYVWNHIRRRPQVEREGIFRVGRLGTPRAVAGNCRRQSVVSPLPRALQRTSKPVTCNERAKAESEAAPRNAPTPPKGIIDLLPLHH